MGTERGCQYKPGSGVNNASPFISRKLVPSIECTHEGCRWVRGCVKDSEGMREQCFPDPKFKPVHEIDNQHPRELELDIEITEALNERILH